MCVANENVEEKNKSTLTYTIFLCIKINKLLPNLIYQRFEKTFQDEDL